MRNKKTINLVKKQPQQRNNNFGQGNHMVIMTSSFLKSSVFKLFSVHRKTQSRCFQLPQVGRAFAKSSVTDKCGPTVDLT